MRYEFNSEEELIRFVKDNILFSNEAADFLGITHQALNQSVKTKKLIPIKKSRSGTLFFKQHVEDRKEELAELRIKYRPYD